jgi:serine/threonine protein kinase
MGKVYLARQEALNRLVCIKVLAIPDGEDVAIWRLRFHREAELLASVSHPNILPIFHFGTTGGSDLPYLLTEYVESGDLRGRMQVGQPMPVHQAQAILRQVADALIYMHAKGILHRDLKPENVLLTDDGLVKVGDLGIAVAQDQAGVLTQSDRGLGTVGYVSPEQQYALGVDERTDQYSLAALSYELLTGRRPLGMFPPPSRTNPRLPRAVDAVILRGLAEEPKDRFPSVKEFAAAFDLALSAPPRRGRSLLLASAALFAILSSATGLAWVLNRGANRDAIPIPNPHAPGAHGKPAEPPAKPVERSPEYNRLVELRAYVIWDRTGRPMGKAGEAVKQTNWLEAERQIRDEVDARAFRIWEKQGRPTGAAGEAVSESNRRAAEIELLQETEAEMRRKPIP